MSTPFRPELSKKNPYYISKNRFYELRYFCLQYYEWKKAIREIDGYYGRTLTLIRKDGSTAGKDPTGEAAMLRDRYEQRIRMVETACEEADPGIAKYLLTGLTEGLSYEFLRAKYEIPCGKDYYYDRYHRALFILSRKNQPPL